MSISTVETKVTYAGNNSIVTPYPIPFKYLEDAHINLYIDGVLQVLGAMQDYVLAGDGAAGTGSLTTKVAQDGTKSLVIVLDVPLDQPVVLQETSSLPAKVMEVEGFDRLNMQIRRVWRKLGDVITFSNDEGGTGSTGTADNLLGFDGSGDIAEIPNSTFVQTADGIDGNGDVTITAPSSGQVLSWNGSAWVNALNGNGDALTADGLDQFANTTSAELRTVISGETGTGGLVFATSPTLVTPDLGTPSAVDLTNATNYPYTPAGTGAVTTTVETKLRESVSVKDFGAVGDGVADDTTKIQAAFDSGAETILIPDGTYLVSSGLTIAHSVKIIGEGDATIDGSTIANGSTFNDVTVLNIYGSGLGSNLSVSSDITAGDNTITMADTSSLLAGDDILISSQQLMVDGYGNSSNKRGEQATIDTVDSGTQITLRSGTLFSYTAASPTIVREIGMLSGVTLQDFSVIAGGVSSWHTGIKLEYLKSFNLSNINVKGGEDVGISTFYSTDGVISGGLIEDSTNPDGGLASSTGTGYGVSLYYASNNISLVGIRFNNCKRGATGGALYPSVYNKVLRCYVENGKNGLGGHEPCWWWTLQDNVVRGMTGVGFNVRGQYTKLINNTIADCAGNGIIVRTYYVNPTGLVGTELIGNVMDNTAGIYLDGDATDGRVIDTIISGGRITNGRYNNITADRSDGVIIRDVLLDGQETAATTDGNGIVLSGTSATLGDKNCTNVSISGVTIPNALRHGILSKYTQGLTIANCTIEGTPQQAVKIEDGTGANINGGTYNGGDTNFTYSIRIDDTTKATVNNCRVYGKDDVAQTSNHGIGFITCTDVVVVGNNVSGHASAVLTSGGDHHVAACNNGRDCYGATIFNISGANQVSANNLI